MKLLLFIYFFAASISSFSMTSSELAHPSNQLLGSTPVVAKQYLLENFFQGNVNRLSHLYLSHPEDLSHLKYKLIEATFETLSREAFTKGDPFNAEAIKKLYQNIDEVIFSSFDVDDLFKNLKSYLVSNGYTMSHLYFSPIEYEEGSAYPMGRHSQIIYTFAYNKALCFIEFNEFSDAAVEEIAPALEHCQKSDANIIFDLSKNTGGTIDSLLRLLSYFLPANSIVGLIASKEVVEAVHNHAGAQYNGQDLFNRALLNPLLTSHFMQSSHEKGYNPLYKGKIAIIIGIKTVSAAEHFAHALKSRRMATLIGTKTLGSSLICQTVTIKDEDLDGEMFGIAYPVGEFIHSEDGRTLEGSGVCPDLEIGELGLDECIRTWLSQDK